jgi:anthranilate synthase component 1
MLTPVGAYLRLREELGAPAFLLESVERGEQVGRYSFLAAGLASVDTLEEASAFAASQPGPGPDQPPFVGGAVGYLAYDWVSQLEPVAQPAAHPDDADLPAMGLLLAETVVAFDHARRTVWVSGPPAEVETVAAALSHPVVVEAVPAMGRRRTETEIEPSSYRAAVGRAKEHIAAGDAFQIVLSQRARRPTAASAFAVYRALRAVNPSP